MYIIWGRNPWICILPACTYVALLVGGVGICVTLATLPKGADLYSAEKEGWAASALGATLLTNMICSGEFLGNINIKRSMSSGMIAWRIWAGERALRIADMTRIAASRMQVRTVTRYVYFNLI